MLIPLLLIVLAIVAAAAVAYGAQPGWIEFQHGLQLILWSRRCQWPLVTLSLLACVALIGLTVCGRRRAWWLVGLAPVLALFVHHFRTQRAPAFEVVENPPLIDADRATALADGEWVVGLNFADTAYAYPYAELFRTPVIVQSDRDQRIVLLWSPYANRALAFRVKTELRARDLEVVSMPADAVLLYNSRSGQFVNGLTGQTPDGQSPAGFAGQISTQKATWKECRQSHPGGKVLWAAGGKSSGPTGPILPASAIAGLRTAAATSGAAPPAGVSGSPTSVGPRARVAVIGTLQPVAINAEAIGPGPINLRADGQPVLVFRPAPGGPIRAFSRRFADDIRSEFVAARDRKHPSVRFRDVDTGTLWDAEGTAIAGNPRFHGKRLTPVAVDEGVDWTVLKYWYPNLELTDMEYNGPAVQEATAAPAQSSLRDRPTPSPQAAPRTGRQLAPRRIPHKQP